MHINNYKDINAVMSMYNLIEYSIHYLQTPGSLWQYYRIQLALNDNGNIVYFPANDDTSL